LNMLYGINGNIWYYCAWGFLEPLNHSTLDWSWGEKIKKVQLYEFGNFLKSLLSVFQSTYFAENDVLTPFILFLDLLDLIET
jgi:hypothetical protein